MARKRNFKFVIFIVSIFLILQLLPVDLSNAEGLADDTHKSNVLLSSNVIDIEAVLHTVRAGPTEYHQKIPGREVGINISSPNADDTGEGGSYSRLRPVDFRDIIRRTIPKHFYGSKYKDGTFVS